jgi:hypothetical protein
MKNLFTTSFILTNNNIVVVVSILPIFYLLQISTFIGSLIALWNNTARQ